MRIIKVRFTEKGYGGVKGIGKMFTMHEGVIEVGVPLYLGDSGTVTPINNGDIIVGWYDISNCI